MSDTPRLCKDCRRVASISAVPRTDADWLDLYTRVAVCRHPTAQGKSSVDLVGGAVTVHWTSCRRHREPGSVCGPEGRWFEPKQGRE